MQKHTICTFLVLWAMLAASAADPLHLATGKEPLKGWVFGNGFEFPGAKGTLSVADGEKPALRLSGDFSGGGQYVEARHVLPGERVDTLSLWLKFPGAKTLTVRFAGQGGLCHQLKLELQKTDDWQKVVFPFARYLRTMGTPEAPTNVAKYQTWKVKDDRGWVGAKYQLCLLFGRHGADPETKKGSLWFRDVKVTFETDAVLKKTVRLDESLQAGVVDWKFDNGREFPGAKGSLDLVKDQPENGKNAMALRGDFTGGGAYVQATKSLTAIGAREFIRIRFKIKSDNVGKLTLRLVDSTNQCHQRKNFKVTPDGKWHEVSLKPEKIAGGEHWGGANDGKWHAPAKLIAIILGKDFAPGSKQPAFMVTDITADALMPAKVAPASYSEDFDASAKVPNGWKVVGDVSVQARFGDKSANALRVHRTLANVDKPVSAVGPTFKAAPGMWLLKGACSSDLHSPDNSFQGVVDIEFMNAGGGVLEKATCALLYKKRSWETFEKQVEAPKGTTGARFKVLLKKTYGTFNVDSLRASYLSPAGEKRIYRMNMPSNRFSNMFFPEDDPAFHVKVRAFRPLSKREQRVVYEIRDYWGAEQFKATEVALAPAGREKQYLVYTGDIQLDKSQLEMGKYYEIHAEIPLERAEPYREYRGLAILPKAETKKYRPKDIPFLGRSWDNRARDYFYLSDRLGIRTCGIWGGWKPEPPYENKAPGLKHVQALDMDWAINSPVSAIEKHRKGYEKWTATPLREGAKKYVETYGKQRLTWFGLGNEPHGGIERVRENVAGYKAVYEGIKAADPNMKVISTAVEPNPLYFQEGYYRYLDYYDFHTYEHYSGVRKTMQKYKALMKKHNAVKPIVSTELGLNSQGRPRWDVAVSLYKKLSVFFAEGGVLVSWFGIQYPDREGKARASFGSAHNVFDCYYNEFNPKLDAVAYYNMINGVCIKKFVQEKHYADKTQAYLFRDKEDRCLQIIWRDEGRKDVFVKLPKVTDVKVTRIDGSIGKLDAAGSGVMLSVSAAPVLLQYKSLENLSDTLGKPLVTVDSLAKEISKGGAAKLVLNGSPKFVTVTPPPLWTVEEKAAGGKAEYTLTCPPDTAAREGRILVKLAGNRGELFLPIMVTE